MFKQHNQDIFDFILDPLSNFNFHDIDHLTINDVGTHLLTIEQSLFIRHKISQLNSMKRQPATRIQAIEFI